jgi:hypothetical protein
MLGKRVGKRGRLSVQQKGEFERHTSLGWCMHRRALACASCIKQYSKSVTVGSWAQSELPSFLLGTFLYFSSE